MVLRPSGTEPKVKVYLEVVIPVGEGIGAYQEARRTGDDALETLRGAVAASPGPARHRRPSARAVASSLVWVVRVMMNRRVLV